MSRLAKDLFFILMLIILLRSEPELLISALLIVPKIGDSDLANNFVTLWGRLYTRDNSSQEDHKF